MEIAEAKRSARLAPQFKARPGGKVEAGRIARRNRAAAFAIVALAERSRDEQRDAGAQRIFTDRGAGIAGVIAEILIDRIAARRHAVAVIAVLDIDHATHAQPVEDVRIGRGAPVQSEADRPRRLRRAVGRDAFLAVTPIAQRDVERVRLADRPGRARVHRILGGIFAGPVGVAEQIDFAFERQLEVGRRPHQRDARADA